WFAYCANRPVSGIDPLGLDVSFGDIMGQLGNGDTWGQGLATSGYALGNLLSLGHAFGDQAGRPGFGASQVAWGVGLGALATAGALAAAPIVATNPAFINWATGGAGAGGAGVAGGGDKFMRLCCA